MVAGSTNVAVSPSPEPLGGRQTRAVSGMSTALASWAGNVPTTAARLQTQPAMLRAAAFLHPAEIVIDMPSSSCSFSIPVRRELAGLSFPLRHQ
jgi:hypothetical protein